MAINQYDQRMYAEYTPLTQQEILMPAMYMRERHDKLEQEYGDLNSELKKISFIVDNERDPQLKAKYQSYLNDLNGAITELDQNGFTPTGKNRALALKAKYNEEILPIPTAYGLKMADIAHYKELKAKDPSYIGVDPYQRSVTDYVNNGNQPMNNPGISGAYIQKLASEAFSAISKTSDYSELHRLLPNINLNRDEFANIYTYMQHNGIDPESDTGKMLTQKVRDYVIGATGVSAWAGQQEIAQIDDHIRIASYQMLGETKSQIINGQSGITSGKKTTKNDNDGSTYSPWKIVEQPFTVGRGIKKEKEEIDKAKSKIYNTRRSNWVEGSDIKYRGINSDGSKNENETKSSRNDFVNKVWHDLIIDGKINIADLNIGGDNSSFVEEAKKLDSYESIIKFVDKYYNDISEKIYGVDEDDMKKAIDKEYRDSVSFHSNGTLSVSESGLRNRFKINIIERISNFVDYKNKTAVKRSINSDFAKKHNLSEKEAEQVYENYIESTSLMIENPLNAIDDDGKKVMKSIGDVYKNQISSNQLKTVYDSDGKIVDFKDIQSKIKHSETQFMGINPIDIKTGIPSLVYEIEADNLKYRVNIPMPDVNIPLDNTANIKKALAKSSGIGDEPVLINDKEHILRKEWDKSHGWRFYVLPLDENGNVDENNKINIYDIFEIDKAKFQSVVSSIVS